MTNTRKQGTTVWTWTPEEPVDRAWQKSRLASAIAARRGLIDSGAVNAYRLVNAESDRMPGLVVDRYADWVVVQFLTLGIESRKREIVDILAELLEPRGIYERSDVDVREKEGLSESVGVLYGSEPPDLIETVENGFRFLVDVKHGHKTGFYLDQSENRKRVAGFLSGCRRGEESGRTDEVLNVFSYTGAFGVYAC